MSKILNLKKIDPVGLGTISAVLYGILGIFYGVIILFITLVGASFSSEIGGSFGQYTPLMGIVIVILMPIIFAIIGFIGGLIGGLILNLSLAVSKGLKITFEEE